MNNQSVHGLIQQALDEDGEIDWSSLPIPDDKHVKAEIWLKESSIVAGLSVVEQVFTTVDSLIKCSSMVPDGTKVGHDSEYFVVMTIEGSAKAILRAERVALNFLQHLSGIATKTAFFVELVKGTSIRIRDTRKTLPGLRTLQKQAVVSGGGANHRMSLSDAVLLKDNHWLFARKMQMTISEYIQQIREKAPKGIEVEIEAKTIEEVKEALQAKPAMILLDNMHPSLLDQAISLIYGQCPIEVSGNMDEQGVRRIAHLPIDFIAIGSLTHSVKAIDYSLEIIM